MLQLVHVGSSQNISQAIVALYLILEQEKCRLVNQRKTNFFIHFFSPAHNLFSIS